MSLYQATQQWVTISSYDLNARLDSPGVAHELPYVFHGVRFGRPWRQGQKRDVGRDHELARGMPSGLIGEEDGVGA